jgi:hypothetical protein
MSDFSLAPYGYGAFDSLGSFTVLKDMPKPPTSHSIAVEAHKNHKNIAKISGAVLCVSIFCIICLCYELAMIERQIYRTGLKGSCIITTKYFDRKKTIILRNEILYRYMWHTIFYGEFHEHLNTILVSDWRTSNPNYNVGEVIRCWIDGNITFTKKYHDTYPSDTAKTAYITIIVYAMTIPISMTILSFVILIICLNRIRGQDEIIVTY